MKKEKINWAMFERHVREAAGSLNNLHEYIKAKSEGKKPEREMSLGELAAEYAHVYHHLNFGWNTRMMDMATAESEFEMHEKWPTYFEQYFRDYEAEEKPVVEFKERTGDWTTVDYDAVDVTGESRKMELPMLIGKKEDGQPLVVDLARLPHLLIAGSTGQGKTTLIETMLYGFLKRFGPNDVKFVLYDEKCVEFVGWWQSPYLAIPVLNDPKKGVAAIKNLVREMDRRLKLFAASRCRNLYDYNHRPNGEGSRMPYLVFVADEISSLIANEGKHAIPYLSRLLAMGRAAGIHVVLATQRPARNILSASLKSNIPGRIALKVCNATDSRQIIDVSGAQNLNGRGDLLFRRDDGDVTRAQGAYVSCDVLYKKIEEASASFKDSVSASDDQTSLGETLSKDIGESASGDSDSSVNDRERLAEDYLKAVAYVRIKKSASTSCLQRGLGFGYNRAAAVLEMMENNGLVGPLEWPKPRRINWDKFPEEH